jgi:hypothetical protein
MKRANYQSLEKKSEHYHLFPTGQVRKKNISTKLYRTTLLIVLTLASFVPFANAQFTPGRLVVVQTSGSVSKAGSAVTLKEYTSTGPAGISVAKPATGANPLQMAAGPGGSEGFLSQSTDGTFLVLAGYSTTSAFADITATTSATVPRVIFKVDDAGNYSQVGTSAAYYNANDIRSAVSDGTNYWACGGSSATDGINYYGPGTQTALGVGAKGYALKIFNGQIYYSTQKPGPNNLGIFSLGGPPTSGTVTPTQIINTGVNTPEDFSFNATNDVCYVAINSTTGSGIQKWTYNGTTWSLAYTLGTGGAATIGAYGLAVDYSGVNPVLYATTTESNTTGNRIIKITDTGSGSLSTTIVPATANTWFHGIAFAPCPTPIPAQPAAFTASMATVTLGQTGVTYTVPNDPSATYIWNYSGTGATINGTGNSVTVDFSSTATNGILKVSATNGCTASAARTIAVTIAGQMRITEFMYNGGGAASVGEFVEFTNIGGAPVDMTGWSFDDNSRTPGSQDLSGFGTVQPGESVILTEITAATFRTNWNLCAGVKIVGGNGNNLGRADEINLYNGLTLIDRLTYDDQTLGGPRTTLKSAWVNPAGLGTNISTQWTLSSAADAEASYVSATSPSTEIGSPGKSTRATVSYDPCLIVNGAPTIFINVSTTTNYLDGAVITSPISPFGISGVISDPTDPASTLGLDFTINDSDTPLGSLAVTAISSNTTVVPNGNVVLSGTGASRNIKITPVAVGYSNITVTVNDGTNNISYIINYAASAASLTPANTKWYTGMSDASDGIYIDNNYFISGDDELDVLNVYSSSNSGLPVASYDYSSNLALPDPSKPEVDLEAATRSTSNANKIYWMGSMSNSKAPFTDKPNRNRIFATTVTGTGAATNFSFSGYYGNLRANILTWGDANGYNFTASAAAGVDSKSPSGFAVEGMVFGPDNTTLYIAMRAPLVPTATRTKAVIVPVTNFETWFNNGAPAGNPTFGAPIELDMGGRGFRDLIRLSNGTYVIVAGNPAGSPLTSAIYKWSGHASDAPIAVTTSADGLLNLEGVMPVYVSGQLSLTQLEVISDGGDEDLYNDGSEAKDFGNLNLRKFRTDLLSPINLCMPITGDTTASICDSFTWYGTTYTTSATPTHVFTNTYGCDSVVTLHLTIKHSTTSTTTVSACDSYLWNGITYTTSNTYTKHFTNAAGCDSLATLILTIKNSTTSTTTVTACDSYLWNGITYTTSNTYTKLLTNAAGCDSTATLLLTINTSPSITGQPADQNLCSGGTISLSVTASGTYQWKKGTNTISGATSSSFSIPGATSTDAGTYTCVVTGIGANTCSSTSNIATVTVSPVPTINAGPDQSLCSMVTTATLAGIATNTTGQNWSTSGSGTFSPSNTTLNATYTISAADITAGTVTLTLHSANTGACTTPVTDAVLISFHICTGVLEATETSEVQLIPNPNVGNVVLKLSEKCQASSFIIFTATGEKIKEMAISSGSTELNLDLQDLKSGVYMLLIKDSEGNQLLKRMIKY